MARPIDRLLFVYKADSGTLNAIIDSAKKLLSINGCALCSLTHSLAGEKSEWQSCKETLGVPVADVLSMRRRVGRRLGVVSAEHAGGRPRAATWRVCDGQSGDPIPKPSQGYAITLLVKELPITARHPRWRAAAHRPPRNSQIGDSENQRDYAVGNGSR